VLAVREGLNLMRDLLLPQIRIASDCQLVRIWDEGVDFKLKEEREGRGKNGSPLFSQFDMGRASAGTWTGSWHRHGRTREHLADTLP
jgi:hypothetical protein